MDEVERIEAISRRLFKPEPEEETPLLEILILFSGLRKWLERIGNFSRTTLALQGVVDEATLGRTLRSLRRLDAPVTAEEIALASALRIDDTGVHGLARKMARAKREGGSPAEVARAILDEEPSVPDWMSEEAAEWLSRREKQEKELCKQLLTELEGRD